MKKSVLIALLGLAEASSLGDAPKSNTAPATEPVKSLGDAKDAKDAKDTAATANPTAFLQMKAATHDEEMDDFDQEAEQVAAEEAD